jgi:hypothetical protein
MQYNKVHEYRLCFVELMQLVNEVKLSVNNENTGAQVYAWLGRMGFDVEADGVAWMHAPEPDAPEAVGDYDREAT